VPNTIVHERVLPPIGTDAIYAYCHGAEPQELHARMFSLLMASSRTPLPAAPPRRSYLCWPRSEADLELSWQIHQGAEMRRFSLIAGRTEKRMGKVTVHIGGFALPVMSGRIDL
jgi:hypothetical protein